VWAGTAGAPVVFFCQNNQYAISTPVFRQSRVPLAVRGRGFGIPGVRVDGNDVLACLAVTEAALARARDGGGPTFVEAVTYRVGPHTTSDEPRRYRVPGELEEWTLRDPLPRAEAWLRGQGHADDAFFAEVAAAADELAARIRSAVLTMADPPGHRLFEHVYALPHTGLEEQARAYAAYLDTFAEGSPGNAAANADNTDATSDSNFA
jgi:pyruvate dehydrogenase E1 component alpha subunit